MAIDLDLSTPPRGVDGLRALVRAIVAADPHDEFDWIEWKSTLDLSDKGGCFHVARAILGLANRPVEIANRTTGGFGYVVVGAEPGSLPGITTVDPADWITIAEKYLNGEKAPAWVPTSVPIDEVTVLVVTVDPPAGGDPIWPLRQEYDKYRKGTVFVRKPGRTDQASDVDLDALQRRLVAGERALPEISVAIRGESPMAWIQRATLEDDVQAWASTRRAPLIAAAEEERRRRTQPTEKKVFTTTGTGLDVLGLSSAAATHAELLASLTSAIDVSGMRGFGSTPDSRTFEEFEQEVDEWCDSLVANARHDLLRRYFAAGHGFGYLFVSNPTDRYLHDVQVKVHIPMKSAKGFDEIPDGKRLPQTPRGFGVPTQMGSGLGFLAGDLARLHPAVLDGYRPQRVSRTTIEDGSLKLTFDVGDLRPYEEDEGEVFHVLLPERPEGGVLTGTWTATVGGRDGRIEGDLTVEVAEHPTPVAHLLDHDPEDDEDDEDEG